MNETQDWLRSLMSRYTTENVDDPVAFKAKIDEFLAMQDAWEMEGFTEAEKDIQRDYSVNFRWGHNHDFGDFQLEGVLGDRHIDILATFIDEFGLPKDLTGKTVLDVGVWCGGTSFLLATMGAKVRALEEVEKYARCAMFLSDAFGLIDSANLFVYGNSLFEEDDNCELMIEEDEYDYIIFPGVLYHLTDPILALRILFNALKDGGELYIETAVDHHPRTIIDYRNGEGNNWFVPTASTLSEMLEKVGFTFNGYTVPDRLFAKATRTEWKPMLKAGLSRRIR